MADDKTVSVAALKKAFCEKCMPALNFDEYSCDYAKACRYHTIIDDVVAAQEEGAENDEGTADVAL